MCEELLPMRGKTSPVFSREPREGHSFWMRSEMPLRVFKPNCFEYFKRGKCSPSGGRLLFPLTCEWLLRHIENLRTKWSEGGFVRISFIVSTLSRSEFHR